MSNPKARIRVTFVLLEQMLGLPEGVHITAIAPSDPGSDTFAVNLRGLGLPFTEEGAELPFLSEVPRGTCGRLRPLRCVTCDSCQGSANSDAVIQDVACISFALGKPSSFRCRYVYDPAPKPTHFVGPNHETIDSVANSLEEAERILTWLRSGGEFLDYKIFPLEACPSYQPCPPPVAEQENLNG